MPFPLFRRYGYTMEMKCLGCGKDTLRPKWCSKNCTAKDYRETHREEKRAKARQLLIDDPIEERARRARVAREWRAKHPDGSRKFKRNKDGVGILANPDDVIFYGYKPPFRKFKEGFGYEGVLMYSKSEGRVQCHFCGRLFRMLNNGHLGKVHGMTASEYKEKVGLKQSSALMGEETREKLLARPYNPNHMEELKKAQKRRAERIKKGLPDLQSGFKQRLEKKNERGTCPEQLLDRIRDAVKQLGHTPTMEEFVRLNEGKYYGSIRNTYGTWTNAVMKLGLQTHYKKYTKDKLLDAMRNFYVVHHRSPKWSDMERGLLPSSTAYYYHFKGINHARLLANVPLVIANGKRKSEEWMPTETQRQQMLAKI